MTWLSPWLIARLSSSMDVMLPVLEVKNMEAVPAVEQEKPSASILGSLLWNPER
eukprot:CAMPEP_0177603508 /NCGR_PEP_ID=MMETSP0419_2-20121207/15555_1 /TAXON_ID=582737 /ORGANISM="Tetraselmis sp., Strain GSL018" /LENGTH=53 /DNA_ID=CAMNT_0019097295 /DNA_START=727 /DNA_END=891 /DNA_ORIENTATION=-